jgi:hypothetical protein
VTIVPGSQDSATSAQFERGSKTRLCEPREPFDLSNPSSLKPPFAGVTLVACVFFFTRITSAVTLRTAVDAKGALKMEAGEPRARHRGFFLHSDTTGEPDTGEHENPEGLIVRVRSPRSHLPRHIDSVASRATSGVRHTNGRSRLDMPSFESQPEIRSGSVTGSRQRAH